MMDMNLENNNIRLLDSSPKSDHYLWSKPCVSRIHFSLSQYIKHLSQHQKQQFLRSPEETSPESKWVLFSSQPNGKHLSQIFISCTLSSHTPTQAGKPRDSHRCEVSSRQHCEGCALLTYAHQLLIEFPYHPGLNQSIHPAQKYTREIMLKFR